MEWNPLSNPFLTPEVTTISTEFHSGTDGQSWAQEF